MKNVSLINDDCLKALKTLADNSVDSCVTDPPYGLSFMGKAWDYDVPKKEIWQEVFRVLKPGGFLLSFGGSRTYHRMACAIEDAGFEIRDQIMWVYGSGFPKSHNIGDGWGTALKPAHEPIVLARKPLSETTVAKNVLKYGTGALNIDGCRVGTADTWAASTRKPSDSIGTFKTGERTTEQHSLGRWPANFIHDGSEEVVELFPDSKSCNSPSSAKPEGTIFGGSRTQGAIYPGETGSAARFFYCAKASKKDRGEGNNHPTVKPTELMRYLCKLITPPKGVVLDPFMGSGSTGKAAKMEDFGFIGIEIDANYFEIAKNRIESNSNLNSFFEDET